MNRIIVIYIVALWLPVSCMVDKTYNLEATIVLVNDTGHNITISPNTKYGWWYPDCFTITANNCWSVTKTINNYEPIVIFSEVEIIIDDRTQISLNANDDKSIYNPCVSENYVRQDTEKNVTFTFTFTEEVIDYIESVI